MITVPANYPGPNSAGAPDNDVPYYVYGHSAGNYLDDIPGPWAAGGVATYVPPPAGSNGHAYFGFVSVDAGQPVGLLLNFISTSSSATVTVDWDDGSSETLSAGGQEAAYVEHTYDATSSRTVRLAGDLSNVNSIYIDRLVDPQTYIGPESVDVQSAYLAGLSIHNWPVSMTLDCPALGFLELGPYGASNPGSAAYVNGLLRSLTINTFILSNGLDGTLDLSSTTVDNFVVYASNVIIPTILTGTAHNFTFYPNDPYESLTCSAGLIDFSQANGTLYIDIGYVNISEITGLSGKSFDYLSLNVLPGLTSIDLSGAICDFISVGSVSDLTQVNLDNFTGNLDYFSAEQLATVSCSTSNYEIMAFLLNMCANFSVNNGTFTATGNGVPVDQAATDKQTLLNRGWTVTTD